MIVSLKINNIALISESNIKFQNGLNVLTGETGAGKSIIIDSLNFVLGCRADKTLIKSGQESATVVGVFQIDVTNDEVIDFFRGIGQEPEDTVIITRTMSTELKNVIQVNGQVVTLGMLKKLTMTMVDIHGQQDHQLLMNISNHIKLFDNYAGHSFDKIKQEISKGVDEVNKINQEISMCGGDGEELSRNVDILQYQINEIESASIVVGQEKELTEELKKLQNSEKIYSCIEQALDSLDGEYSVVSGVKSSAQNMLGVLQYDDTLVSLKERMDNVKYELDDITETLKDYRDKIEFSEARLNEIEERLDCIRTLKHKYGNSEELILEFLASAKEKLEKYQNNDQILQDLNTKKNQVLDNLYDSACELTRQRKQLARVFEDAIKLELKELNMVNADFVVDFENTYNRDNIESHITKNGADKIEFLFSANLGEPVKSLDKIISGGEMSRFMLSFKCVVGGNDASKTFVFDEIDAGIGGKVGVAVGKKLAKISKVNQVLCISHLAQIASFADNHFRIEKYEKDGKTFTEIERLDKDGAINELCRMIGSTTSEISRIHANEMYKESQLYKQSL